MTRQSHLSANVSTLDWQRSQDINHNLDQAIRCAQYPWKELAWDQARCRYLMGLYYATWPRLREFGKHPYEHH